MGSIDNYAGKRILIVEDNLLLALVHKRFLERMGHSTTQVDSAEEAIIEAKKQKPDLILMDINLNGKMDGIKAAQEIHKHATVPIIYLSGSASNRHYKKAKRIGYAGYLVKPVQNDELEKSVHQVFATA